MALSMPAVFQQLRPTINRVNGMIRRGVVRRVNDTRLMQVLQLSLLEGEVADDVEHLQPFGLSFVPPLQSEVVALSVGGNADHVFALGASSREHRPTGAEEGEGGLYTLTGWKVFCDAEGNVFIGADEEGGATHKVAMADAVESELNKIKNALGAAQVAVVGGSSAGTYPLGYSSPLLAYTSVADVGSETVKVTP